MADNLRHRRNNAVGVQAQSTINDTERRRIVLLGKTGVGKSSTGNTILGEKRFECKKSLNSVTKQCSVEESVVEGRYVTVIDTPGFFDITIPEEELSEQIAWSLFESAPGAHAFLFILPLDRFTKQEEEVLTEIQNIFGKDVLKYLIILFTNGDGFELDTIDSEVKKNTLLGQTVKRCQGYHVFNNTDQTNRKQVTVLMQKIETMIEQNGGGHYTNEMYQVAHRLRLEEEGKLRREEERRNREEPEYSGEHVGFLESERLIPQDERAPMEWTEQHDVLLCREILLTEPFRYKKGSVDKGKAWSAIADTLNSSQDLKFKVMQRSVRERFNLIQAKYKARNNKDEKSSGTSAEITELDALIEEITEKEKAAEENKASDESMRKLETDRAKAEEARKRAMERVSQTNRRLSEEGEDLTNNKRRRRSGNDTIDFLRERSQTERFLREKELELKRIEIEGQAKAAEEAQNR